MPEARLPRMIKEEMKVSIRGKVPLICGSQNDTEQVYQTE